MDTPSACQQRVTDLLTQWTSRSARARRIDSPDYTRNSDAWPMEIGAQNIPTTAAHWTSAAHSVQSAWRTKPVQT